jgi:glutamyl-tRNA synthetase
MDENENWMSQGVNQASRQVAEKFGINHKKILMPLLFATLMGKHFGPPLFDSAELLGKDRTRVRLMNSIQFLGGISNKKMDALKKAWDQNTCKELITS